MLKGLNVCDDRRDGGPDNHNPNRNRDGRGDQRHRVQFHFDDSPRSTLMILVLWANATPDHSLLRGVDRV